MYKVLGIALLVAAVCCQDTKVNIDALIAEVFGPEPTSIKPGNVETKAPETKAPDTKEPETEKPCTMYNGDRGVCVPYYLCETLTLPNDGEAILDIREPQNDCENYIQVCCAPTSKQS